jgi:hypothetical protein
MRARLMRLPLGRSSRSERGFIVNTINDWDTTARVHNPERLEIWKSIVGGDVIPIKSLVPVMGGVEGIDEPQRFYMLDLDALDAEQYDKLKKSLSNKFGIDNGDIDFLLEKYGVPVLSADVTASTTDKRVMASFL